MPNIYAVYCPFCGSDTGIGTRNKELLKELEYFCPVCSKKGEAEKGIVKEVNKEEWINKKEYYGN